MAKHQTKQYPVSDFLRLGEFVTKVVKKANVVKWGTTLKKTLQEWMNDVDSPFSAVQQDLRSSIRKPLDLITAGSTNATSVTFKISNDHLCSTALLLLNDLNRQGALPVLLFSYDREYCERTAFDVLKRLENAERRWKESSPEWEKKMLEYKAWKNDAPRREKVAKQQLKAEAGASKMGMVREAASRGVHPMESFNPEAPLPLFSFADHSKLLPSELGKYARSLEWLNLNPKLIQCLRRGIGVHHAGMNRGYRQVYVYYLLFVLISDHLERVTDFVIQCRDVVPKGVSDRGHRYCNARPRHQHSLQDSFLFWRLGIPNCAHLSTGSRSIWPSRLRPARKRSVHGHEAGAGVRDHVIQASGSTGPLPTLYDVDIPTFGSPSPNGARRVRSQFHLLNALTDASLSWRTV